MTKKYILRPGKHQFAPGSPAEHDNDNLSDEEAAWYLKVYPHIRSLFTPQPPEEGAESFKEDEVKIKLKRKRISKEVSSLTPPLGGGGAT